MQDSSPIKITRPDGRTSYATLRPLAAEVSCLSRSDGSCKFSSGSTTILAAVFGPAAPRAISRARNNEATVAVVFKYGSKISSSSTTNGSKSYHPGYGTNERELERFIGDALQGCIDTKFYPRTIIEVVIQVMNADGSVLSSAINAAVLALMDAGVRMNQIPIGTTCLVNCSDSSENILFDPTAEEESNDEYAAIILATTDKDDDDNEDYNSSAARVISSLTFGQFQLESFLACIESSERASKAMLAFMRVVQEQKVVRESKTLWSSYNK
jgi:ribonuclease PH